MISFKMPPHKKSISSLIPASNFKKIPLPSLKNNALRLNYAFWLLIPTELQIPSIVFIDPGLPFISFVLWAGEQAHKWSYGKSSTQFSPVLNFIQKPVNCFIKQNKLLVFISDVNTGLKWVKVAGYPRAIVRTLSNSF